jgi:hypothetical protein
MLDSERSIGTNVSVAIECIEVFTITPFSRYIKALHTLGSWLREEAESWIARGKSALD